LEVVVVEEGMMLVLEVLVVAEDHDREFSIFPKVQVPTSSILLDLDLLTMKTHNDCTLI
jgi:hypothetical protein